MTAGGVYAVAGLLNGPPAREGNTGLATHAWLGTTIGAVRLDSAGNLVVPDGGEIDVAGFFAPSVRVVAARTGVFYGLPMTAGDIYIVAGDKTSPGSDGLGDGGPALGATFDSPEPVALSPAADLVIGDAFDDRVRAISR
jgi:hypothetical protein